MKVMNEPKKIGRDAFHCVPDFAIARPPVRARALAARRAPRTPTESANVPSAEEFRDAGGTRPYLRGHVSTRETVSCRCHRKREL